MTKIEKLVLGLIVVLLFGMAYTSYYAFNEIAKSGGLKEVIIQSGKEFKDINRQINEGL